MVVLGGDAHVGRPRCVEHAWQLREHIRTRHPELELGGWANPNAAPGPQVDYLLDRQANADFYLTQIASHHHARAIDAYLNEARRRDLTLPAVFGVFFYRSAKASTLAALQHSSSRCRSRS